MEKEIFIDCKKIQKVFKIYGGEKITINRAYSLWRNHSKRYCAFWEVDCKGIDDKFLYELLHNEIIEDVFNAIGSYIK